MRPPVIGVALLLSSIPQLVFAATTWGFTDATVSLQSKGSGVGSGLKEKFAPNKPLSKKVELGPADTLKILLTAQEGTSAKRPHQAFLLVEDLASGLDTSFPLTVKDNGKSKVELTQKEIPVQLLHSAQPLVASLVIASFGSSAPYKGKVFDIAIQLDPNVPSTKPEAPLRYGKLPEIHHVFRPDARSPPKIITLVFTAAVLGFVPVLFGAWLTLGGNVDHLSKALGSAPISHGLFFGSIIAMEGIFFMYYTTWNLFTTLPIAGAVGTVIFLSGSRALTEVQERRLAGLR